MVWVIKVYVIIMGLHDIRQEYVNTLTQLYKIENRKRPSTTNSVYFI